MDNGAHDDAAPITLAEFVRVRRALAHLGADANSAPPVPPGVSARVGAALQAAPVHRVIAGEPAAPAHSARLSRAPQLRRGAAWLGVGAAVAAVVLGAATLLRPPPDRTTAVGPTAHRITVSPAPPHIPLSDSQLLGLLSTPPDYGPLTNPQRRASCLAGLGYPVTTTVLGAQPLDLDGRPTVLLLLAGDAVGHVVALAVAPTCSAADTGLLASREIIRP